MVEEFETFAAFARSLARAARRETLPGCRAGLAGVENKLSEGFDPVTEHDRNSERAMRRLIEERFPEHGIAGEELPERPASGRWSWSLDPIDGTRAYICGLPSWTTLIALLDDGDPVLGVVDVPRLDELYLGHSRGAWLAGGEGGERRLAASACRRVEDARLSTTDPYLFEGPEAEGFERLRRSARLTRYGLDAYGYALVAAGTLDIVAESGLKPHDYHALVPLVRGAGGAVSNWSGGTDLRSGQIVAAANEALLEQACRLLSA
ncbi:MAG TPA: inositol monophosphatase family protein [Allosphingosinicella sp.]|jgi:myo-inositol-1(or 4)-monophosphatase|nr:inositol monophosphatase family protein [Allosphingosinicella sp.]